MQPIFFPFPHEFSLPCFTDKQKSSVSGLLRLIEKKSNDRTAHLKDSHYKIFLLHDNDPLSLQINSLFMTILEDPFQFRKSSDFLLLEKITKLFNDIQEASKPLESWSNELNAFEIVCKNTLPHPQPYLDHLDRIRIEYGKSILQNLFNAEDQLNIEITNRLQLCEKLDISKKSYEILSLSHDVSEDYLKANICDFHQRTRHLKDKKIKLLEMTDHLQQSITSFKQKFNSLYCFFKNESFFNWGSNNHIEDPLQKPILIEDCSKNSLETFLKDESVLERLILNLNAKQGIQENLPLSPPLTSLEREVQNWTPCRRKVRLDQDVLLNTDSLMFIKETDEFIKKFETWNSSNISSQTISDYKKIDFKNLATRYKDLFSKLTLRISRDSPHKISLTSLKLIAVSHDVKVENIKDGLSSCHQFTADFENLVKLLPLKMTALNRTIATFQKKFNLNAYLLQENVEESYWKLLYFDFWYDRGYFNQYIHQKPSKSLPSSESDNVEFEKRN